MKNRLCIIVKVRYLQSFKIVVNHNSRFNLARFFNIKHSQMPDIDIRTISW